MRGAILVKQTDVNARTKDPNETVNPILETAPLPGI